MRLQHVQTTVAALGVIGLLLPQAVFAGPRLPQIVNLAFNVLQSLVPIVIGLAVLTFLWGVLNYVIRDDESGKASGREFMLWGIIALFVMVSIWGLVFVLRQTLGLGRFDQTPLAPNVTFRQVAVPAGSVQKPLQTVIARVVSIIGAVIPVLIALGVLFFLWGVYNYVKTENADNKAKAASYIVWGVLLLFVMVSVWGLVDLIGQTLNVNTRGTSIPIRGGMPLRNLIK